VLNVNIVVLRPLTQRTAKRAVQSAVHLVVPGIFNNNEYGNLESRLVNSGK
jgi:hypothetical protein